MEPPNSALLVPSRRFFALHEVVCHLHLGAQSGSAPLCRCGVRGQSGSLFTTTATAGGCSLESPGWRKWGRRTPSIGTERPRKNMALRRRSEITETLRVRYNQSKGLHTWQWMYGCELQADGRKGGFMQYGYNGRTFITFDKERLTWVAPQPQAQITQRKWDALPGLNQYLKSYLEEECIEWLEKYLSYGKETLLRTEPPEVTMSSKTEMKDGMETHVCCLDGFYPREIDASWTRDGEVWLQDTLRGSVVPNADGTFHAWLSIQIDSKERGRYRCHMEQNGLQEPLDVALKGERLQGGKGWALGQAGGMWEGNLTPAVSRCEHT
ncbi:hypothetical protein Chor_011694 [Crotalus horridus]